MKTTVILFIALVTLLPHSANATTLTITGGTIVTSLAAPLGGGEEQLALFGGDDFSVEWHGEPGSSGDLTPAFGVEPFVHSIDPFLTSPFSRTDVRVGIQHCYGSLFPRVSCGDITLTSPGFAMPADWPIDTPFVATVPFTATGQLLVGGNQYDMVGQGTVTGTRCLTPCGPLEMRARLAYTFSVGEPPSLVLMLASTIAIGIAFLVHRSPICSRRTRFSSVT
jgi:hypothetical protein